MSTGKDTPWGAMSSRTDAVGRDRGRRAVAVGCGERGLLGRRHGRQQWQDRRCRTHKREAQRDTRALHADSPEVQLQVGQTAQSSEAVVRFVRPDLARPSAGEPLGASCPESEHGGVGVGRVADDECGEQGAQDPCVEDGGVTACGEDEPPSPHQAPRPLARCKPAETNVSPRRRRGQGVLRELFVNGACGRQTVACPSNAALTLASRPERPVSVWARSTGRGPRAEGRSR